MQAYSFFTVLCFAVIAASSEATTKSRITFNENGTFKILAFTDLHYGEYLAADRATTKVMTDVLAWESPDFVVFTGDMLDRTAYSVSYVDKLFQPVVEGNYKWASTYGNHDSGNYVSRTQILAAEQKYVNSYTESGAANGLSGVTNYYIPVYATNKNESNSEEVPALILWFFDSQTGFTGSNVIQWFKNESNHMNQTWGPIPALAYFHHPTFEYEDLHEIINSRPECTGQRNDYVSPQSNRELIDTLAESGVVKATFVGHSHGLGWCCNLDAMVLCFNRQTGYGGWNGGTQRGGRVVELSLADPWGQDVNYVRLENGTVTDYFPGSLL